jgi:hypothetical protein
VVKYKPCKLKIVGSNHIPDNILVNFCVSAGKFCVQWKTPVLGRVSSPEKSDGAGELPYRGCIFEVQMVKVTSVPGTVWSISLRAGERNSTNNFVSVHIYKFTKTLMTGSEALSLIELIKCM